MENAVSSFRPLAVSRWRELVMPKEHGSWSLALEPLVLALLVFPSGAGGALALAVIAAFFARRPLRTAWTERRAGRRAGARVALVALGVLAGAGIAAAIALGGVAWMAWLLPAVIAGAAFVHFDLRNAGREEAAEIAGAAAFAWLPAAIGVLGGASALGALALAVVMCGRSVPSVMAVRAALRGAKTGAWRTTPALAAATGAVVLGAVFAVVGDAPWTAVALLALLAVRGYVFLVHPRPRLRARTLGMIEGALGVGFVVAAAVAWSI
jgi:hypothetical protein